MVQHFDFLELGQKLSWTWAILESLCGTSNLTVCEHVSPSLGLRSENVLPCLSVSSWCVIYKK